MAFTDKYQLQAIFQYANNTWGKIDPDTGRWDGVVGMVNFFVKNSPPEAAYVGGERVGAGRLMWEGKEWAPPGKIRSASARQD